MSSTLRNPHLTVLLTSCSPTWSDSSQAAFQLFLSIACYIIPLSIMFIFYIQIARCLWSTAIPSEASEWGGVGWGGVGWGGVGWAGLGWAGLGWAGLGWAGLGWTWLPLPLMCPCPSTNPLSPALTTAPSLVTAPPFPLVPTPPSLLISRPFLPFSAQASFPFKHVWSNLPLFLNNLVPTVRKGPPPAHLPWINPCGKFVTLDGRVLAAI